MAPLAYLFAIKHKYFNQSLRNAVEKVDRPVKQVVILGAGFDTHAVRKKKYKLKYFEIDQPEVLSIKASIYQKAGIDPNARYIGINYLEQDLIQSLIEQGLHLDLATHFIWEGNVFYLPLEAVKRTIQQIKTYFVGGVTISFDYKSTSKAGVEHRDRELAIATVGKIAKLKTPFLSTIDDIGALAKELDMEVIEKHTMNQLIRKYGIDDNPDQSPQHYYRHYYQVCTLQSQRVAHDETEIARSTESRRP